MNCGTIHFYSFHHNSAAATLIYMDSRSTFNSIQSPNTQHFDCILMEHGQNTVCTHNLQPLTIYLYALQESKHTAVLHHKSHVRLLDIYLLSPQSPPQLRIQCGGVCSAVPHMSAHHVASYDRSNKIKRNEV